MVPSVDQRTLQRGVTRPVSWRGRSGRVHALSPLRLETLALHDEGLYLIALGPHPLWAGAASDIIGDPESRARFRLALACGDRAFKVAVSGDEVERMTIIWDLEGAEPEVERNAA